MPNRYLSLLFFISLNGWAVSQDCRYEVDEVVAICESSLKDAAAGRYMYDYNNDSGGMNGGGGTLSAALKAVISQISARQRLCAENQQKCKNDCAEARKQALAQKNQPMVAEINKNEKSCYDRTEENIKWAQSKIAEYAAQSKASLTTQGSAHDTTPTRPAQPAGTPAPPPRAPAAVRQPCNDMRCPDFNVRF